MRMLVPNYRSKITNLKLRLKNLGFSCKKLYGSNSQANPSHPYLFQRNCATKNELEFDFGLELTCNIVYIIFKNHYYSGNDILNNEDKTDNMFVLKQIVIKNIDIFSR